MIGDLESDNAAIDAADKEPSTDDKDGLLTTAKAWFREDREHSADWRTDAKEDFDFVAGAQWSEEDRQVLRDQMRPEITFNRVLPTVKSVVGIEIGNRREVRYIPRSEGDEKPDEILTAAAQWARDNCDAEDEETDAFFDLVTCGMGWVDTRMDYEEDPDGRIVEERLDPLEMYWDGSARKRNLVGARRTWRVRTMPIGDARLLAPDDTEDADLDATWARGEKTKEPHNADPQVAYQQDVGEELDKPTSKEVTIVHLQWWERETYYRVAFNGRVESVGEDQVATLEERATKLIAAGLVQGPFKKVKQVRKVYKQAIIGAKVLTMGPGPCEGHFSWECITGERDHNKGTWFGLVRSMKDPQRWANKWLSQSLHILNSNAKGGLFAERGAFDNDRDAEESYARADRLTWLKPGALAAGKIKEKTTAAFPQGFSDLMQFAIASIRDVTGVNAELLGLAGIDQAGVLEEHRKQAGMTILAGLFDALRRFRKRQGRILLYLITTYLSDGRLIRIVGDEGAKYVPLIHQPGLVEYDVIVDDEATSPNQKEKTWTVLMQMLPMLGQNIDASDIAMLAEMSPLPTSFVEKWQRKIEESQQQNAPIEQRMKELEMMVAETKGLLQKAQADKASADAAKTQSEIGQSPGGMPAALEHEHRMHELAADTSTAQTKIAADAAGKRDQTLAKVTIDREKIASNERVAAGWMASDQVVQQHKDRVAGAAKMVSAGIIAAAKPKPSATKRK